MSGWIKDLVTQLLATVLTGLTTATQTALNWVLGLLSSTVFASPDVTVVPQVHTIAGRGLLIANACMGLIVVVVGALAMGHGTVQDRASLKELLPRMLLGFAAANLATPVVRAAIVGANAVTDALAGEPVDSQDSFGQIQRVVADTTSDPAFFPLRALLQLLVLWMLVLLVLTWVGRVMALLVVAGTAPVALMCHSLPVTEAIARLWWRSLVGCLAVQVLQAVTLHLAVDTLLSSDATLPQLRLPHDPTGLFNLLIACFLLWLVIRIPTWVARTFAGPSGRAANLLGSIVRVVVVQQLLGAVGLRGGRRLAARRAAGGRVPATHLHAHRHANTHQHLHQHLHVHPPRGDVGGNRPPRPGQGGGPGGGPEGGPGGGSGGGQHPPRRVPSWMGPPSSGPGSRAHPGRPPRAIEGRPALPPATRRALGPGPEPAPPGGGGGPRPGPPPGPRPGRPPAPVRPYTPQELAEGVDVYTRSLKRRGGSPPPQGRNR